MKVVLTGATGFIGLETLQQCLKTEAITSLVVLARRPLPELKDHAKVQAVQVGDFLDYSEETREAFRGADACIWCLGKAYVHDLKQARAINHDFPLYGERVLAQVKADELKAAQAAGTAASFKPLRFVYLSGSAVVRDQTQSLWFLPGNRRIRGEIENSVLNLAGENKGVVEALIAKPPLVLRRKSGGPVAWIGSLLPSIQVDVLGRALVRAAVEGYNGDTLDSEVLQKLGSAQQ